MAAFGEVTKLLAKVETEPIKKISLKKPVKKKLVSVKDKETTASKNRQRDTYTDEKIASHISKLETEFHQKVRLMEEKYNAKMSGLEKRTKDLETTNEKQENVIMELLKRIHNTHKEDKNNLTDRIDNLENAMEKANVSATAANRALDKTMTKVDARMSAHKKEMTNLMYRIDNLDRRVDNRIRDDDNEYGIPSHHTVRRDDVDDSRAYDSSVSPVKFTRSRAGSTPMKKKKKVTIKDHHEAASPYKYSRPHMSGSIPLQQDITALKYDFLTLQERVSKLAKKRTLSTPGTYAEPASMEEILEQVQELQGEMNALNKHTHKSLKTQDAAIMCLYKNSDFKTKMKVTPQELIEVFGRLSEGDEQSLQNATSMFGISPRKNKAPSSSTPKR